MKLEVGMYVRTKYGDVFILDRIEDNHLIPRYVYIPYVIVEEDVIKTSHNIIDLIEVGDYVNGEEVWLVANEKLFVGTIEQGYYLEEFEKWEGLKIKTIVTKEQFESMAYKVV